MCSVYYGESIWGLLLKKMVLKLCCSCWCLFTGNPKFQVDCVKGSDSMGPCIRCSSFPVVSIGEENNAFFRSNVRNKKHLGTQPLFRCLLYANRNNKPSRTNVELGNPSKTTSKSWQAQQNQFKPQICSRTNLSKWGCF